MAQEPTFPTDAAIGEDAIAQPNSNEPMNETLRDALTAKQAKERSEEAEDGTGRNRRLIKGAAIGVGSAALVAALIYARKSYYCSGRDDD